MFIVSFLTSTQIQFMKPFLYLFSIFIFACSSSKVSYDYDTQQDFSQYKTYNYYPELQTGLSELDDKRLLNATDSILKTKGLVKSETPDLHINFKSNTYQARSNTNFGVGIGVGRGPVNVGGGLPLNGLQQRIQLIVDLIDTKTNALVWQAEIDDTQNSKQTPETRTSFFRIMMGKVFSKFDFSK